MVSTWTVQQLECRCGVYCVSETHMHSQNAPWQDFSVLSDAEVPRLDPHHVIKHELQVQPAFHTNLSQRTEKCRLVLTASATDWTDRFFFIHGIIICTCVNIGLPFWVTMVHWSQSSDTKLLWKDSFGCFRTQNSSVAPPSKILRKYRGINVLPMAAHRKDNFIMI